MSTLLIGQMSILNFLFAENTFKEGCESKWSNRYVTWLFHVG